MIRDRSIVMRFSLIGHLQGALEYLGRHEALLAEDEWFWTTDRALAFPFDSHREAAAAAKGRPYTMADGTTHEPWAVVLGGDETLQLEREQRHSARDTQLEATVRRHVSPQESYAELEKRGLA